MYFKKQLNLIFQLTISNFKLRNEGSYLGVLWYIIEPLVMFFIFLKIRNVIGTGVPDYPLYLLLGLIMYNFFRHATNTSVKAITSNPGLIQTVKINPFVFVISSVLMSVFSHVFEVALFLVFFVYFGGTAVFLIFYLLVFLFFLMFVFGVSFIVSTIGVYLSDFSNVWTVFVRLLWFATPIFYSARLELPFNFNAINPLYYFITFGRDIVVYESVPSLNIMLGSLLFSFGFLLVGLFVFHKFKDNFAEEI